MRLLDIFCGAGGASKGYAMAGFDVTGIDVKSGKRYPFTYIKKDFKTLTVEDLQNYDVIHASPPCQTFSITKNLRIAQNKKTDKEDLLDVTRQLLIDSGKPYVLENVPGAPLRNPIQLCGSVFNLQVRRHRLFESNMPLKGSGCDHKQQGRPVGIYGSLNDKIPGGGQTAKTIEIAREAMGINWMIWTELVEAIPPMYTEFIGKQVMTYLQR
jgi:DNA (cytosine-5)-methyltransferase 1